MTFTRNGSVHLKRLDGSGGVEEVFSGDAYFSESVWSSDGEWLVVRTQPDRDIFGIRPNADSQTLDLLVTEFDEAAPAVSPDGRWLAYVSNESGEFEVYVRPFPTGDGKWQVSTDGGRQPVWARNGRELFYTNDGPELVAVATTTTPTFSHGEHRVLFDMPPGSGLRYQWHQRYDVSLDGQRFLMFRTPGGQDATDSEKLIVVENFFEELKAKVGN